MEQFQLDPASIMTQAVLSSVFAGATAFASTIISHAFVQPMVQAISNQVSSIFAGGLKSINKDDVPPSIFSIFPSIPPPPFIVNFTRDGQLQINLPVADMVSQFMPLFSIPSYSEGAQQ